MTAPANRCESVNPFDPAIRCTKERGHDDPQHVYQGLAWPSGRTWRQGTAVAKTDGLGHVRPGGVQKCECSE